MNLAQGEGMLTLGIVPQQSAPNISEFENRVAAVMILFT
jgi:hypothetical protein